MAQDAAWGDLSGRFIWDGEPPQVRKIPVTKDRQAFGAELEDRSLRVSPHNRGLADVVLYLLPDREQVREHPSYQKTAQSKVQLKMEQGQFVPRLLLLRTTQTMVQVNRDMAGHHARIDFLSNAPK